MEKNRLKPIAYILTLNLKPKCFNYKLKTINQIEKRNRYILYVRVTS